MTLTRAEARRIDAYARDVLGLPTLVLMENAALNLAAVVDDLVRDDPARLPSRTRVDAVCGTGSNGGDGYAAARHLLGRGYEVRAWRAGPADRARGDSAVNRNALRRMGLAERTLTGADDLTDSDVVIDAVLGSGFDPAGGPLRPDAAAAVRAVNAAGDAGAVVVAADVPTGLDADRGATVADLNDGRVVRADVTVSFVAAKIGLTACPAAAGRVIVADIGLPDAAVIAALTHLRESDDAGA